MGDGSAAWCMNQGSGSSMASAYLGLAPAQEIFGGARDVLAWGYGPNGRAVRTAGGWRVTGTWAFASGSRHATWLGAHCLCVEADGSPIPGPDGAKTWERTGLFRREKAEIKDTWQVLGLRGTGSDTYSIHDLFIDDAHMITRDYAGERREQGPLYRFAMMQLYASGFACVGLGLARQMLDDFVIMARGKTPALSQTLLRDSHTVQGIIGHSDARLKAARNWLIQLLAETYAAVAVSGALTLDQRMAIRQASTYAIHEARDVATAVFHEAGSTAIFDNQPFERRLRDINSVSQQLQGRRAHFETIGQHLLGMEAGLRWV
jgi:alkylation response protein AidB-like acyl-CoA dehydrogenase